MRTGRLRKRVQIQTLTKTQNGLGDEVDDWTVAVPPVTVWGEMTPVLSGTREAFAAAAGQFQAKATVQWRLRYRALSPATNRLIADGQTYEIEAVLDPDGRKRELLAICYVVQR